MAGGGDAFCIGLVHAGKMHFELHGEAEALVAARPMPTEARTVASSGMAARLLSWETAKRMAPR